MNERLKKLAEQAGFDVEQTAYGKKVFIDDRGVTDQLERFAELVRADEREACAKLCDELAESSSDHEAGAALNIREAIRARGDK
jgi:hypothetical protein